MSAAIFLLVMVEENLFSCFIYKDSIIFLFPPHTGGSTSKATSADVSVFTECPVHF